jgi:hypothetical protein
MQDGWKKSHINRDKCVEKCNCLDDGVLFSLILITEVMQNEKRKNLLSAVLCGNMICNDSLMTKLGDILENKVGDSINESRTKDSITHLLCETEILLMLNASDC